MAKVKIPKWVTNKWHPKRGGGNKADHTACIMEVVALISPNTKSFTDQPKCVTQSLNSFMIGVNDTTYSNKVRKRLVKFAPRLLETTGKAKELNKKTNQWITSYVKKHNIEPITQSTSYWASTKIDIRKGKNLRASLDNARSVIHKRYPINNPTSDYNSYGKVSEDVELKRMRDLESLLSFILPENDHIVPEWDNLRPFVKKSMKSPA